MKSAQVRARLTHPVIDTDGHMVECFPVLFDYLKQVGGPEMTERTWASFRRQNSRGWYEMSPAERRHHNQMRPAFWAAPAENTRDRATAMMPRLMHERLPEMGIDFAVIYPTIGFLLPDIPDAEVRQAACRAQNLMMADMYRGCEDRLTPAAVIPCHTPAEAIAELDFAIGELGFKVPMFANLVRRPVGAVAEREPGLEPYAFWVDTLALDSLFDYEPLWRKCMQLKVPFTSHAIGQGIGMRRSPSNYMYNQTGHFADAGHAFAKALFFGGVTRRFPDLNFAFLECGVAWGATLLCDLKERWEKRNFAAAEVQSLDDLYRRLVPRFFYGCEADDRMNATAFDTRLLPGGVRLNAVFSSDVGHWDVPDMSAVLAEAWELVEEGLIGENDFRDFVFTNPVKLLAGMNPDFFRGTAVESETGRLASVLTDSADA
jgi:predicted TIM-barrel fold metal-dependent hydrolase